MPEPSARKRATRRIRAVAAPLATLPGIALLVTLALVAASFGLRTTCLVDSGWSAHGVSPHPGAWATAHVCGSDIQRLWSLRQLWQHLPPYLHGVFTPPSTLTGGTVEYPVLSGLWIWATAALVTTDTAFVIVNAVLFVPIALGVSWLVWRMAGRRVWIWAAAPALLFFSVYNWDLAPTLCSVAGLAAVVLRRDQWSDARIGVVSGVLFGVGAALKLVPGFLALPVALWLLRRALERGASRRDALGAALVPVGAASAVLVVTNLPFAMLGFRGWWASFAFQSDRALSIDTQSLWYWLLRAAGHTGDRQLLPAVNLVTSTAVALGIAAVLWRCWTATRGGEFPVVPAATVIIAADLLLAKVHSPQYVLWLVPLLAISQLRVRWIVAYFAADVAMWLFWNAFIAQLHTVGYEVPWMVNVLAVLVVAKSATIGAIGAVLLQQSGLRDSPMGAIRQQGRRERNLESV